MSRIGLQISQDLVVPRIVGIRRRHGKIQKPAHRLGADEVRALIHGRSWVFDLPNAADVCALFEMVIGDSSSPELRGHAEPRWPSPNDAILLSLVPHLRRHSILPLTLATLGSH